MSELARKEDKFILWFSEIGMDDVPLVGGKVASLGEMVNELAPLGAKVPDGFGITTTAYNYFFKKGIKSKITRLLDDFANGLLSLDDTSAAIRRVILKTPLPSDLREEIVSAYRTMESRFGPRRRFASRLDVAVRSSATAEDTDEASFAGQLESFLNVRGEDELLDKVVRCFASNFTSRVIDYREGLGYDHLEVAMSVGVQKMVRSDKASSGTVFTVETDTGFDDAIVVNAGLGLGEPIVGGQINSDEYIVSKRMLRQGLRPIIGHTVVKKPRKMIYAFSEGATTAVVPVPRRDQKEPAIDEDEILQLARWGVLVEDHYGKPMDIEWAKDGYSNELFLVQARPATGMQEVGLEFNEYTLESGNPEKILEGSSVGRKVAHGRVRVVENFSEAHRFQLGEILVTHMTNPSWAPTMKKARAIITNEGGRKCHAALVAGELEVDESIRIKGEGVGIPCVIGTLTATETLQDGDWVTVDCSQGEVGFVYKGKEPFSMRKVSFKGFEMPETDLMLFANRPLGIFGKSHVPSSGVGLSRTELVIEEILGNLHPMAWVEYPDVSSEAREVIDDCASHYADKKQYFVDKFAEAWGRIAAAFYPRPVVIRFSDFKADEYADLLEGRRFEPVDDPNPLISVRGAFKYLTPEYVPAFKLECAAIKKAREVFGFTNIIPMVPFCRTPEEGRKVLALMKEYGLEQGVNGLEVYVMVETTSNAVLADVFADIFDGGSIGSNDFVVGVFSADVRGVKGLDESYNENHEAVRRLLGPAIKAFHKKGKKIGICGEAPSYLMEFTRFLVACGIDSITITSNSLEQYKDTAEAIRRFEEELEV